MKFLRRRIGHSVSILAPMLLALVTIVSAQTPSSQPPTPAPAKASQDPEQSTATKQQSTAPQQSVASQPTPSSNQVPAQIPQLVIQQTNGQEHDESSTNRWITIFTGGLVVVGLLSVWVLSRQTSILKEQVAISRLTHRATVVVHGVAVDGFNSGELANKLYNPRAIAINIGETGATILHVEMRWCIERFLPIENPLAHLKMPDDGIAYLKPGDTTALGADDLPIDFGIHRHLWGSGAGSAHDPEANKIYLFGVVKYLDDLKNERRTYFCRRLDPVARRFVYEPNADYEYAY